MTSLFSGQTGLLHKLCTGSLPLTISGGNAENQRNADEMEITVDYLFEKIKQSEKEAQSRKSALNELKQAIFTIQEQIKVTESVCVKLQKEFDEKLQELSELEYNTKIEDIQFEIYTQEKEELELEVTELKNKQSELCDTLEEAKLKLCNDIEGVTVFYGFRENGRKLRSEKYEEELTNLKEKEELLSKDIQVYSEKTIEVDSLLEQTNNLQHQFDELKEEKNKLQCQLDKETRNTMEMESHYQITRGMLDSGFVSIQQDVMKEKENAKELDQKCCNLQKELQSLHQKNWQKNLQTRRLPQLKKSDGTENRETESGHRTDDDPYFVIEEDLDAVFSDTDDFTSDWFTNGKKSKS